MASGKQQDENYDSAADSEIDLDKERGEPAAKKAKTSKKSTATVPELQDKIKKSLSQKEKLAVKIKMMETRLMMAKTQEMKVDCEVMRNQQLLKEMGN